MGYENLDFINIQDVMLGANERKYKQNPYSFGYIEKAIVFYNDNTSAIIEFTDASDTKDFCKTMKEHSIDLDKKVFKMNTKLWKATYKEAKKDSEEEQEENKVKNALVTAGLIAGVGVIAATSGALGYKLASGKDSKNTTIENNDDVNGFGLYSYDLSNFADMDQYADQIPDSFQKENAFNYLNILQKFNNNISLVDETEQLGGLTIEQLIAVDAYSNSNIYSKEDYVKNFGLYDFSNISNNFQQGAITTGAYLATGQVDGTVLANIFKDEKVKEFYLKALEYHDNILHAEDSKVKKQAISDFEEYMNDVAVDQTSEFYLDYNLHPGLAFANTVIINSLNYNNIKLSSELISDTIVIGDGEHQSKLDTICDSANIKLDSAISLISELENAIINNSNLKIYNYAEMEKAQAENREAKLLSLKYEDLDTLVSTTLCDQEQINNLINKEIEMSNQLVTIEDQEKINTNAIEISRSLQNKGSNFENKEMANIASQLQNKGDVAVVTDEVTITSEEDKKDLYSSNSSAVENAKIEESKQTGNIPYETEKDKEAAEEKIKLDVETAQKEGTAFVDQVVAYYESHGNVSGIPAELNDAYNNLGASIFNTAKNTGIARWKVKNNPITGGVITPITSNESNQTTEEIIKPDEVISNEQPSVSEPTQTPSNSENNTANDNDLVSGGEITILPGFEDIDIIPDSGIATQSIEITDDELTAYLNTDEGQQFLEAVTASETEIENTLGMSK